MRAIFKWIFPALLSGTAALLACFPLQWAASWVLPDTIDTLAPDLDMHGTIWRGTVTGLPVFQTVNANSSLFARRLAFDAGTGRNFAAGVLSPAGIRDLDFRLDFSTVPFTDGRLRGLRGELDAQISEMIIEDQACASATGTARTDVLQRNAGTVQWTGPELSGPIQCEDGALIVNMAGQDAQQQISAVVKIMPNGLYRAEVDVRTARPEADAVLPLFGFTRSGQSFVLTEQGKWR